jgi:hypothetical protein
MNILTQRHYKVCCWDYVFIVFLNSPTIFLNLKLKCYKYPVKFGDTSLQNTLLSAISKLFVCTAVKTLIGCVIL